ncbi:hypothetical protein [Pseudaquabacterium rugosum]|uniref:Uncharacterized protein n=1 Tax=Pseudaquabacterium rugosum TaxID=2984194 RepID=A0ABU9BEW4_9BURK
MTRQAAAAHMGCTADDIDALKQGDFIEYVKAEKLRTWGRVSIPGSRSPRRSPAGQTGKASRTPTGKTARGL